MSDENNKLNGTELTDDEVEQVTGGKFYSVTYCMNEQDVTYIHDIGDIVEVASGWGFNTTVRCRITDRRVSWYEATNAGLFGAPNAFGYRDEYFCEALSKPWYFFADKSWMTRSHIQM